MNFRWVKAVMLFAVRPEMSTAWCELSCSSHSLPRSSPSSSHPTISLHYLSVLAYVLIDFLPSSLSVRGPLCYSSPLIFFELFAHETEIGKGCILFSRLGCFVVSRSVTLIQSHHLIIRWLTSDVFISSKHLGLNIISRRSNQCVFKLSSELLMHLWKFSVDIISVA